MNEISHEQARRLIQEEADGLLETGSSARQEWANLHAHLETCAVCRAEAERMRVLQRDVRTALQWALELHQPPLLNPRPLAEARVLHTERNRRLRLAALVLPLAVLLIALAVWLRVDLLAQALLDPWGTASKTFYDSFDGAIVFESRHDGNMNLYLLQGGPRPRSLTANSLADDSDPLWSPDGAWVAFLSDRAADPLNARAIEMREGVVARNMLFNTPTPLAGESLSPGKREVFVLDPFGDQSPIQISAAPDVAWNGPLSWSADGKTLALNGQLLPAEIYGPRQPQQDSWAYSVALDGSGHNKLPATRGAQVTQLSPGGSWIGVQQAEQPGAQFVFTQVEDPAASVNVLLPPATNAGEYRPGPGFAWSPGGGQLAYIVEGPFLNRGGAYQPASRAVSQLRRVVNFPGRMPTAMSGLPLVELPLVDGLRDVAWSPDGFSLVLLQGGPQDLCWPLLVGRMPQVAETQMQIYPVDGLCAEEPLTRRPFTPDGRWLLFRGRWQGANAAIYALDVQQALEHPNWAPLVARLTDPNGLDRLPQVQPDFPNLGLTPGAAAAPVTTVLARSALADAPGWLAFNVPRGETGLDLLAARPSDVAAGMLQPVVISEQPGDEDSPAWSPTGQQIAWVGMRQTDNHASDLHLFTRRLTGEAIDLTLNGYAGISAVSWSPDGAYLSAVIDYQPQTTIGSGNLMVFGQGSDPREMFTIQSAVSSVLPLTAWQPLLSGRGRIATLISGKPSSGLRRYSLALALVNIDPMYVTRNAFLTYQGLEGIQASQARGLAWSPQGDQVAVLVQEQEGGLNTPRIFIFASAADRAVRSSISAWFNSVALPDLPGERLSWNDFHWRPGADSLSLVVNEARRARLVLYPSSGGPCQVLLTWDEPILQHAWSPDGAWLAFSAESGVWIVPVQANQLVSAPFRLVGQSGGALAWGP